jgi:hypothetical protein
MAFSSLGIDPLSAQQAALPDVMQQKTVHCILSILTFRLEAEQLLNVQESERYLLEVYRGKRRFQGVYKFSCFTIHAPPPIAEEAPSGPYLPLTTQSSSYNRMFGNSVTGIDRLEKRCDQRGATVRPKPPDRLCREDGR